MTLQRFIVAYIFQPLSLPLNRLAAQWRLRRLERLRVRRRHTGLRHLRGRRGSGTAPAGPSSLFGVMHAVYICINEAWREVQAQTTAQAAAGRPTPARIAAMGGRRRHHAITLLAVIFANVLFRAATRRRRHVHVWRGMSGLAGLGAGRSRGLGWGLAAALTASVLLVFLPPNTQQIMGRFDPAYNWDEWQAVGHAPLSWTWKPNLAGLAFAGAALFLGIVFIERGQAVFLYFNF